MTCWKALYWQLAATVSFQLSPQGGGRREEGGDMESQESICALPQGVGHLATEAH